MCNLFKMFKTILATKPSNAFLLFITGFFFSQFILVNILYRKDPLGGWVTGLGTFTNASILFTLLFALTVCLITLWISVAKHKKSKAASVTKNSMIRTQNIYSPIDFPKGSTVAAVPSYSSA